MMPGSECGTTTLRNTSLRWAPSVYETSMSERGTVRTTSAVMRVLKKTVPTKSRAILDGSPRPSQMMSSGMNALAGRYRSSAITGSNRAWPAWKVPMTTPSGTEISTARPNPRSTRCAVAATSPSSSPDRTISTPAESTACGDGRKVADTASLALSAIQASRGIASDIIVRVPRPARGIGVRMASSDGVRAGRGRRGSGGHP